MECPIIITLAVLYFLPTVIAAIRGHRSGVSVLAMNVLLGWTLVGWAVAIAWALSNNTWREEKRRAKLYRRD